MKNNGLYGSIEIPPTKLDNELTSSLIEYQHKCNLVESEQDRQKKIMVLKFLKDIVKNWVRELIINKGMSENLSKDIKIKICTFGSYKLGVSSKTSDIDTILITPIHVDREDFFEGLYPKLKENERVTKIQPIKGAFVPLMNFEIDGVEIDLIFARLSMNNISKDIDLTDINILKNLDRSNVRSLNGYRDTCSMLDYVPNLPSFRTALVALKHWAKNRGLYSNSFGFFGGISWAMLCAVICQIYPLSQPSTLLKKFFHLFSQWNWKNPVQLNKVVDHRFTDSLKGTPLDVWSPFEDGNHMPVITPCYPAMNSTHNVSYSTKTTIIEEFKRGEEIIINIEEKKDVWDTLFQPVPFFSSFPHFVCIHIFSKNPEDLHSLKGWFESKIKMLTKILEDSPAIQFVRPFPQCFKDEEDVCSVYFYLGIKIQIKCVNLKEELEKNISFFYQKISFEKKEDNSLTMKTLKRKDLPKWLPRKFFSDVVPTRRKRSLPNSTQPPQQVPINVDQTPKSSEQVPKNSPQPLQSVDQSPVVEQPQQTSSSTEQIEFNKPVSSEMKAPELVSVIPPSEDTQGNSKKLKLDTKENGKPVITSMANHSPIVERLDSNIFAPKKKEEKVKPTFTISFN